MNRGLLTVVRVMELVVAVVVMEVVVTGGGDGGCGLLVAVVMEEGVMIVEVLKVMLMRLG